MNISDAAKKAGLPAKTIRYYEDIGLIKPLRDANGYRAFRDAKADAAGFSALLSTDVTHFYSPHLGLSIQAACGGLYDAVGKRVLPELRLGVGLTF